MPSRSVSATATAAGAAYLGASPSPVLHSTWSQCGWVDQPTAGRSPLAASSSASAARSATVTAGSMSRQPPDEPTTTVLVVTAYPLVATSTPGATSVKRPIEPVYHQLHASVFWVAGRARASADGHQFHRPISIAADGTSKVRTRNVSISTPSARPTPTFTIVRTFCAPA